MFKTRTQPIHDYTEDSHTRTMTSPKQPCITLRRLSSGDTSAPSLRSATSVESTGSFELRPSSRNSSVGSVSSNKLTGNPGFIVYDPESQSPTKILPTNPRHVRGGSISSDISDIQGDQVIPMQQCPQDMLIPLLHRHLEMKQLMTCNSSKFARLATSMGAERYRQAEELWARVTRAEMDDNEWLYHSRTLLPSRTDWSLFCELIAWDPANAVTYSPKPSIENAYSHERRHSSASLLEREHTIPEEEEC